MGGASARLAGTYDARGEATVVNIKVAGGRMSAPELEAFLPALGIHLPRGAHLAAGTIEANLNVTGAIGRLVAAGHVGLSKARLTGFDLGSKMRAISAFTGLHTGSDLNIDDLTTNMRVAADGLRFDHFNADVASLGHITGAGTIDARNNLHFVMVATVANPAMLNPLSTAGATAGTAIGTVGGAIGGLFGALIGGHPSKGHAPKGHEPAATSQGNTQRIPFLVEGTTSNPQIIPDLSGVALHMLQGQLGGLALPR